MKAEEIICYVEYTHKGISLYKVNDFDNKSYITIDKKALLKMIEGDMDLEVLIHYHYGKFSDEQLNHVLRRVKEIIKTNDVYKDYCNVKDIIFV
jgi:hypothetical protein